MDTSRTFQTVTDNFLITLIRNARNRLVFIAPGVRKKVAEALVEAAFRIGNSGVVNYILDVDSEVCRLGYGEIDGIKLLRETPGFNGNILNAQPGVRVVEGLIAS